jgi:rubrerythrin
MEFLAAIFSIIMIIIFLVMASNISTIKFEIKNINRIFTSWSETNGGYGITYLCHKCKKKFEGQPDKCPHCGELTSFKK